MTEVKIDTLKDKYVITAKGHATGSERVCAAVSALMYTIAGWVVNYSMQISTEDNHILPADFRLSFKRGKRERVAYEMALVGFAQLAESHPEHIKLQIESDRKKF